MNEEVEVVANEKQKQTSSESLKERERETQKNREERERDRKEKKNGYEHQQFGKIPVVSVVLFFSCSVLCKKKTKKNERSTLLCVPENRTGTFNSVLVVAVGGDDGFFFPRNFQIFPMSWRRN